MAAYQLSKSGAQIEKALDDATKVVANPSTTASAGLNKITIGETTYSVQGGGGTYVEANPEGEATDTLNKVTIGETIYAVEGGSTTTGIRTFEFIPDFESAEYSQQIIDDATGEEIDWADFEELLEKETVGIHFDNIINNFNDAKIKFSVSNILIHTPTDFDWSNPYFKGIAEVQSVVDYEAGESADIPIWENIGTLSVLFFIEENNYRINLEHINYNDIILNLWNDDGTDILGLGSFCTQPWIEMNEISGYSLYYFVEELDFQWIPYKLSTSNQDTDDIIWYEFFNAYFTENDQYKLIYKSTTTNKKCNIYINVDYDEATAFIDHVDITEEGGSDITNEELETLDNLMSDELITFNFVDGANKVCFTYYIEPESSLDSLVDDDTLNPDQPIIHKTNFQYNNYYYFGNYQTEYWDDLSLIHPGQNIKILSME